VTILEDIQNSAVDGKSDLSTLLRKCKVLAARLGSQPLENWLVWESDGYPKEEPVPDYRIWPLEVFGHFSGPFGSAIRNAPIPIALLKFISEETKQLYVRYQSRDSVAAIEAILSKTTKAKVMVSTGNLAVAIGMDLYQGYNCVQTWAEFSTQHLVELLNSVRNRILDFALALSKEAPNAGELQKDSTSPSTDVNKVTQIFSTTVYGGSANLVGTASGSSIVFNVGPKDFSSLESVLIATGVSPGDVEKLKTALDSDPPPTSRENFGPKVSSWIGTMIEKAASGGWGIGIGAAGNLLSQAIAKYYGLL
jgi:hypothetical protein